MCNDERATVGAWDQFEANAKLFGVQTTYQEEFYTTPLDRDSQFYHQRHKEAKRIAGEIKTVHYPLPFIVLCLIN